MCHKSNSAGKLEPFDFRSALGVTFGVRIASSNVLARRLCIVLCTHVQSSFTRISNEAELFHFAEPPSVQMTYFYFTPMSLDRKEGII